MRISIRVLVILIPTVLVIMGSYMVISHRVRQDLFRGDMIRDLETLTRSVQVIANNTLRDGRVHDLDTKLRTVAEGGDVFAIVAFDANGAVVAGSARDMDCVRRFLPSTVLTIGSGSGSALCTWDIVWRAVPIRAPAVTLVVATREALDVAPIAEGLRRHLMLTFILMVAISIAVAVVLNRVLAPLGLMARAIRSMGRTGALPHLEIPHSAGELADLSVALNRMAEQITEKQRQLLAQAEERVALERRLREAEKFAVLGRISGGLAHELASPLSVIGMRAEAIRATPQLPHVVYSNATTIVKGAGRMADFIAGLLYLARRGEIVREPVEFRQLVEDVQHDLAHDIEQAEIELEYDRPEEPVPLSGQEALLRHAVRNVIRNAIQALHNHAGERYLHIALSRSRGKAVLMVRDSGPGIPEDDLLHVFEPFFSTKTKGNGLGLGLSISRQIVEEHGGELQLENHPAGGVRVKLRLPLEGVRDKRSEQRAEAVPTEI